jgi:LacI family transcriptional regulator
MQQIDRRSPVPLHHQVTSALRAELGRGAWEPGTLIPSERELCQRFGVSSITVRRALRDLVQDGLIYRETGVGTFVAQTRRRRRIGLVVAGFRGESWRQRGRMFGDLIGGIGEIAWQHNALLSVVSVEDEEDLAEYLASVGREGQFDGLLIRPIGDLEPRQVLVPDGKGVPLVVIKRYHESDAWPCVVPDDVRAAEMATAHVLAQGHRRVGAILGPAKQQLFRDRRLGYERALRRAGIEPVPAWCPHGAGFDTVDGVNAARILLGIRPRLTALLVAGEMMAAGVYRAVREAGLRIPGDVAIVGFDESGETAHLDPPMTSIGVPYHRLGREATRMLLDLLDGRTTAPPRVVLRSELTVRASSRGRTGDHRRRAS